VNKIANSKYRKLPTPQKMPAIGELFVEVAGVEGLEPPTPGFGVREAPFHLILSNANGYGFSEVFPDRTDATMRSRYIIYGDVWVQTWVQDQAS
jgi:hypothetical protein